MNEQREFNEDEIGRVLKFINQVLEGETPIDLPEQLAQRGDLQDLQARIKNLQEYILALVDGDFSQDLQFKGVLADTFTAWIVGQQQAALERERVQARLREINRDLQSEIHERKRLEEDEREARQMAEKLRVAGDELNKSLDFNALLQAILVQVGKIIPYDGANIFILEGKRVVLRKHLGYEKFGNGVQEQLSGFSLNPQKVHMFRTILETHQPQVIPDTLNDPRWMKFNLNIPRVRSWCGFPLIVHDEVYGFLGLDKLEPDFYTEDLLQYLQIFAGQASLALNNALLFGEMRKMARLDPLTGIFNRRAFFERAQEELKRSCRYGSDVSILMLDVDHFKHINDTYGHLVGDQVLQGVARLCQGELRVVDRLARYGGEEFVVLLPETGSERAAATAERLRELIGESQIDTDAGAVCCTVSVGVTSFHRNCETLEELLERADQALYRAKNAGRNCVEIL